MGIILFSAGVLALLFIAPHDLEWISYFADHQGDWFTELMSESLFELEKPDGGDIVVLFFTVSLVLYCAASLVDTAWPQGKVLYHIREWLLKRAGFADYLRRHRLQLEFLVVSSFCSSTLMVKTLKWVMARPRLHPVTASVVILPEKNCAGEGCCRLVLKVGESAYTTLPDRTLV